MSNTGRQNNDLTPGRKGTLTLIVDCWEGNGINMSLLVFTPNVGDTRVGNASTGKAVDKKSGFILFQIPESPNKQSISAWNVSR